MKKYIILISWIVFVLFGCTARLNGIYAIYDKNKLKEAAEFNQDEKFYGLSVSTLQREGQIKYLLGEDILKIIKKDGTDTEEIPLYLRDIKSSFGIIEYFKASESNNDWIDIYRISDANLSEEERLTLAKRIKEEGINLVQYPIIASNSKESESLKPDRPPYKPDKTPPKISIIEPSLQRGIKLVKNDKVVLIKGKVTDERGVFEVTVNWKEAKLSEDGSFWMKLKLKVGENPVIIRATDINENVSAKKFTLVRASSEPAPQVVMQSEKDIIQANYHALIIGVQDYSSSDINDLTYPIEDTKKVFDVLTRYYFFDSHNVILLKNPTSSEIIQTLTHLSRKLGKEDNLFVYYAGHGYWDEQFRQGYWLPSDASWNDRSRWISNSTIRDYIRGIKTQHTLLVSDACFSGGIFKTRKAFIKPDISIQKVYSMPSRKAITSGALKTVPDRSFFVKYFLKRLKENQNKYLYSEKLYINMKDAVINNSTTNQTPLFGVIGQSGDEGGDFIFVRR